MKISFAVTCHNEGEPLEQCLSQIICHMRPEDELIVLDDYSDDETTLEVLQNAAEGYRATVVKHEFEGDFAEHKNHLNSLCTGDYIFQIDADEYLGSNLITHIHTVLDLNPLVDLIWVPRVNTVEGITPGDLVQYGWMQDDQQRIMWPDFQGRIYRNTPSIKWVGKVHERIDGHEKTAHLPKEEGWAIIHTKTIDKQRKQNELYSRMM